MTARRWGYIQDLDVVAQQLANALRDGILPDVTIFTHMPTQDIDDHPVATVAIATGTRRPYYPTDKGLRPSGVYVRQGTCSALALEDAIQRMIRLTDGDSFENGRSLIQDLTFHAYAAEIQQPPFLRSGAVPNPWNPGCRWTLHQSETSGLEPMPKLHQAGCLSRETGRTILPPGSHRGLRDQTGKDSELL